MRRFVISKKLLNDDKVVCEISVSDGYIRVKSIDATLVRVLEELYKQEAWKRVERNEEVTHAKITDKIKAFVYNLTSKLPSPYYFDKITKSLVSPKYDKYIR